MKKSVITIIPGTAEPVFDLTTVEAVNAELNLTSGTANDAAVAAQITSCSRIIADLCGRVFALQTVTETFRPHWKDHIQSLILARYPVVGDVSLTVNARAYDDSYYSLDPDDGILNYIHGHWHGVIAVTYTGGYDLPDDAPAGLARACVEIIREQRSSVGRNPGIRSVMAGENRVDFFDARTASGSMGGAVSPNVEGLISPFRRLAV